MRVELCYAIKACDEHTVTRKQSIRSHLTVIKLVSVNDENTMSPWGQEWYAVLV